MRFVRAAAAAAVLTGISLLAACGGGGGGGSTPPVVNPPSASPPGPPPASSSPSPAPTMNPTHAPTATPPPTPTPKPPPTPTPTPSSTATPPPSQITLQVGNGSINGLDDQIKSSAKNTHNNTGEGDLTGSDPGALPQGGGQGADVDGIQSATSMSDNYHVHAFVGIMVNGQEIALPDGIGMVNPFGDFQATDSCTGGTPNFECYADAFYYIHTHDASGAVHMESPTPVCGKAANYANNCDMSLFTLGNVLDIWGISLTANNFGPYSGPVSVYTSPLKYNPCNSTGNACYTPSNTYSLYTAGDPHGIPLYSHTVVWIVVGSQPARPADLPNIEWYLSF